MPERMSLLIYVNDKEISRNPGFAEYFFKNEKIQDFLLGLIPGTADLPCPEQNPGLLKAYIKLRGSLTKTGLSAYNDELARIQASGTNLIPYDSSLYPGLLKTITDPPLLLYHKGNLRDFNNGIAIIGTRSPSEYGKQLTHQLCSSFVSRGYTVVSGLAAGIDTEAHREALASGGKTIAVLAGHIDDIYPRSNLSLAREILQSGAIISEVSALVKTHKGRFISRNRLTSGISQCVIAVETHGGGGTLQQFTIAKAQGKPVFICRPLESDIGSMKGFTELTALGAIPIDNADDVINYLNKTVLPPTLNVAGKKRSVHASLDQFSI